MWTTAINAYRRKAEPGQKLIIQKTEVIPAVSTGLGSSLAQKILISFAKLYKYWNTNWTWTLKTT